ncbi:vesicle-associated membrane protein-associated protein A isoform 1-T1 [Aplochiton taeniatus]
MSKAEQMLIIDPPYDLKFKGPFSEVVTSSLSLRNPLDRRVCFKVKTTAPRRYCVRPNSGLIEPGDAVSVSVMLQPFEYDPTEKNRHKFMVQSLLAPPVLHDLEAVWRDARPEELMDSKLRCVFEIPSDTNRQLVGRMADHTPNARSHGDRVASTPGQLAFRTPIGSRHLLTPDPGNQPLYPGNSQSEFMLAPSSVRKSDIQSAPSRAIPISSSRLDVGPALDQSDGRRLLEECHRLRVEVGRLSEENRQLKDEGGKGRRLHRPNSSSAPYSISTASKGPTLGSSLCSLMVVMAAILIGLFLGKFYL